MGTPSREFKMTTVVLSAGVGQQLVGRHHRRAYLLVVNEGTNDATMGFDAIPTYGQGAPLDAAAGASKTGGVYEWRGENGGLVPTNAITAISSSGTTVTVIEASD